MAIAKKRKRAKFAIMNEGCSVDDDDGALERCCCG